MSLLMLRQNWPGTFQRAIRRPNGEVKKILKFEPGKPVELKGAALAAVQRAIGPALVEVDLDEKGRPREKKEPAAEKSESITYTQAELDAAVAAAKAESVADQQPQDDPQQAASAMV